ncbi:hypothetical protein YQE_10046, partial [Dendroctonus ponderosae]
MDIPCPGTRRAKPKSLARTATKNGAAATKELLKGDPDAHNFQENTYKKITPCDVCSQILRGRIRSMQNSIIFMNALHRRHQINNNPSPLATPRMLCVVARKCRRVVFCHSHELAMLPLPSWLNFSKEDDP